MRKEDIAVNRYGWRVFALTVAAHVLAILVAYWLMSWLLPEIWH